MRQQHKWALAAMASAVVLSGCAVQRTTAPASLVVSVETPSTSGSAQPSTTAGAYVALGDSLAAGYQPGSGDIRETSYPALLAARLKAEGIELELTNLGCSGETSTTLVKGGKCTFDGASQLADAEKALKAAGARAELVTVDIGGNDVLHCARGLTIDQACAEKGLATLKNTLPGALTRLRAAAGAETPILVLGYYNPFVAASIRSSSNPDLEAARAIFDRLNDQIVAATKATGATYVSVEKAFSVGDTTPESVEGRSVPAEVAAVCRLTYACTVGDIHLTDEGAATVAGVLATAVKGAGIG